MNLNDHLRNILDEVPGVQARDFIKAWNREQRTVCGERKWRDLRDQIQFTVGASTALGTVVTSLPYTTGTVSGSFNSNTITGSGTAWLGGWNGLNAAQIVVDGEHIYDILTVNSVGQTLTVYPKLRTTYSGNTYRIYWVAGAYINPGTGREIMSVRWLGKVNTDRSEIRQTQPYDYCLDRKLIYDGSENYYYLELTDEGNTGDFVLHYYIAPRTITTMDQFIELPVYVQDVIYCRLLARYIMRAPMDVQTKGFLAAEAKQRAASAMRTAVNLDETQDRHEGTNQSTIWIPDRYSTGRF